MISSSAKRLVLIPNIIRTAAASALSSSLSSSAASRITDKALLKHTSPLLLRHITTERRKKQTDETTIPPMVTMTKTSATPNNITHVDVELVTTTTDNTSSLLDNTPTSPHTDLLSSPPPTTSNNNTTTPTSIQNNDSIHITASAVQQIHRLATQKRPDAPHNLYLRVYVDAGGCSGFEYKFELEFKDDSDTLIDPDEDVVINASLEDGSIEGGVEVVVDESSLEIIRGSTVDFVREMIRSSFAIVDNPQSESACGCGSSFAVKNFAASS